MGEKRAIGIDIGREALKYVVVTMQKNNVVVDTCGVRFLHVPAEADTAAWRTAATAALKELVAEKRIPTGAAVITAPTAHTLIRALKLPTATLDKNLADDAKQQLPFPLETLDWSTITVATDGDQSHVSLVAVKKDVNAELLALMADAGIDVAGIESGALALGNVLLRAHGGSVTPASAILSIGASATNLTIVDGTKVWMRTLPVTGSAMVAALCKNLTLTPEQARETLANSVNLAGQPDTDNDATKNVRAAITRLIMEITRSLTFYKSQLNGDKPAKLLLTGGYAAIPGVHEFLADRLKMDVEPLAVFAGASGGDADQAQLLSEAFGCALSAAGAATYALNVLPAELKTQRAFDRKKPLLIAAAVLLTIVFAGLFAQAMVKKGQAVERAAAAQATLERAQRVDRQIQDINKKLNAELKESENLRRVVWDRDMYAQFLEAVAAALPTNAWLNGVETRTFAELYEKERSLLPATSAERAMTVEDEDALARIVRIVLRGGCYGKWEEINAAMHTVPGVARANQSGLTQWKKYIDFELEADLDWNGNGVRDYDEIKQAYSVQAKGR